MSENRKCVNCRHNIRKEKPLTDEELSRIKFEDLIPLMVLVGAFGNNLKDKKEQESNE